jgi:hypothetical protein
MSVERQAVIDCAFNQFVRDDGNCVEAALMKGVYACHMHPKVIQGEISEEEAFLELLCKFTDKNNDGRIHRDEWNAHWQAVSENIPEDDHFKSLMMQMWRL